MPFGKLIPEMETYLANLCAGRHVWDLGAGDCIRSLGLYNLGASRVTAVDKAFLKGELGNPSVAEGLPDLYRDDWFSAIACYFEDLFSGNHIPRDGIDIAFVSWPVDKRSMSGLVKVLEASDVIVYLGKNTDGTQCGNAELFRYLLHREILVHIPCEINTLIVYGDVRMCRRERILFEEYCAFYHGLVSYDSGYAQLNQDMLYWLNFGS